MKWLKQQDDYSTCNFKKYVIWYRERPWIVTPGSVPQVEGKVFKLTSLYSVRPDFYFPLSIHLDYVDWKDYNTSFGRNFDCNEQYLIVYGYKKHDGEYAHQSDFYIVKYSNVFACREVLVDGTPGKTIHATAWAFIDTPYVGNTESAGTPRYTWRKEGPYVTTKEAKITYLGNELPVPKTSTDGSWIMPISDYVKSIYGANSYVPTTSTQHWSNMGNTLGLPKQPRVTNDDWDMFQIGKSKVPAHLQKIFDERLNEATKCMPKLPDTTTQYMPKALQSYNLRGQSHDYLEMNKAFVQEGRYRGTYPAWLMSLKKSYPKQLILWNCHYESTLVGATTAGPIKKFTMQEYMTVIRNGRRISSIETELKIPQEQRGSLSGIFFYHENGNHDDRGMYYDTNYCVIETEINGMIRELHLEKGLIMKEVISKAGMLIPLWVRTKSNNCGEMVDIDTITLFSENMNERVDAHDYFYTPRYDAFVANKT